MERRDPWGARTSAVVSIVVWEALLPERPTSLRADVAHIMARGGGYIAEVEVSNEGLETAANVDIEGVSGSGTATATIDYVPGQGSVRGYLRFERNPQPLVVTVKGWSEP
ncbi:MAG: hypothetical protein EON87_11640 [Brevundimonas sp.]|nr:MAG: hypothetical protein EON87_11640 [Brevundimonas sp.]